MVVTAGATDGSTATNADGTSVHIADMVKAAAATATTTSRQWWGDTGMRKAGPELGRFTVSSTMKASFRVVVVAAALALGWLVTHLGTSDISIMSSAGSDGDAIGVGIATLHPSTASGVPFPRCGWSFLRYHPSAVERSWRANISYTQNNVCAATLAIEQECATWVDYATASRNLTSAGDAQTCASWPAPTQPSANATLYNVLSAFEYAWRCSDGRGGGVDVAHADGAPPNVFVPIEPLAGPLRHPSFCIVKAKRAAARPSLRQLSLESVPFLLAREYLVFDAWASASVGRGVPALHQQQDRAVLPAVPNRALLFDVGASTYRTGLGGPSQPYFVEWIRSSPCLALTGVYAWEANPRYHTPTLWEEVPGTARVSLSCACACAHSGR